MLRNFLVPKCRNKYLADLAEKGQYTHTGDVSEGLSVRHILNTMYGLYHVAETQALFQITTTKTFRKFTSYFQNISILFQMIPNYTLPYQIILLTTPLSESSLSTLSEQAD